MEDDNYKTMILFSIIIPVYNTKEYYLKRCIKSFINQSYKYWEILLIDDGSSQETSSLCDVFSTYDKRIRVFHQQNAGVSSARNLGLSHANGDWIGFSDSDDEVSNGTLYEIVTIITKNDDIQLVRIPAYYYYGTVNSKIKKDMPKLVYGKLVKNILFRQRRNEVWNYFLRKDLIGDNKFNQDVKIGEDVLFLLPIWEKVKCAYFSEKGMYYYYYMENSAMNSLKFKRQEADEKLLREIIKLKISKRTLTDISIYFTNLYCRKNSVVTDGMKDMLERLFGRVSIWEIFTCNLTTRQKLHLLFSKYNIYKLI